MQDEQQLEDDTEEEEGGGFRMWLEDNLRIILSILVVFAIAGGIYSYSQRSQTPAITEETTGTPSDQTAQNPTDQNAKPTEGWVFPPGLENAMSSSSLPALPRILYRPYRP